MATTYPETGIPFPKVEYERRQQKVFEAMARAKLDALVVTALGHGRYLTGYPGYGAYFAPFPLILVPGRVPTYVVREYEVTAVRADSCVEEIHSYTHRQQFAKVCADVLRRYGVHNQRVGFELSCWNLTPADLSALHEQLPDMTIADASSLVALVAAVKSELELGVMRDAIVMTDLAVQTFQDSLRDGVTEAEVAAAIDGAVKKVGGEIRSGNTNIIFGERTKLPHGFPSRHPIRNNEPAMIEIGGAKHGYAAGLVRGAVLGRHPETESLYGLSVEALESAIAAIKPGVTAGEVDAVARKVIDRSARPRAFRHRTGYQTGIHWSERGNISLEPGGAEILQAGMTFHMPLILFGESGHLFGCSEHVLVTEAGAEILSRTPRTLYRA
ncbi:M24 family metallopeptidase [Bradyrhizobium ivorense]|uniref:M24 family metallopeptidase n=1 Tax=Bradyrhizobium ivorense TaxID=2511166 RepID=UPI0010BB322E|nr:Xaa-Pro peptidase family protein [Bradyrhizobium ivorense]VIO67556.1 Ectoine hydrolase [Bradyrhizobium ivorense]